MCSNLCRDLSCCLASIMLECIVNWSVGEAREERDRRMGNEDREKVGEKVRQTQVLLLCSVDSRQNWFSYLKGSPTGLFLPFVPASITYLSRVWMIYTLHMSTTDQYTHEWLPELRDLTDTRTRQMETQTRKGQMNMGKRNNQSW